MKKIFLAVTIFPLLLIAEPISLTSWTLGKYTKLEDRAGQHFLVVDVPEEAMDGSYLSTAEFDLRGHAGTSTTFSMRLNVEGIEKVKNAGRRGVKFMVTYRNPEGRAIWHGGYGIYGPAKDETFRFLSPIDDFVTTATLVLGIEKNFGRVEFDLDSFRAENFFSPDLSTRQAVYTDRLKAEPRRRGVMSPGGNMKPEDFETLKHWNVNLVRFQMQRLHQDCTDLAVYDRWLEERLDHFEKLSKTASDNGIKFILDLHSPPGGREMGNPEMLMFHDSKYADHFVEVWRRIARRVKGNPSVYAYDLVNEPYQTGDAKFGYLELQKRAAQAIREIDPDTPITIESNQLSSPAAFRYFDTLELPDIIYQVHMYVPEAFTHQNTKGSIYPGEINGVLWNKEKLREILEPVRAFQLRHRARIYVGEFSALAWANGADRYLADCIELFEEYGWDWSYHAFREWSAWSIEHEGPSSKELKPSADNPRKQILMKGFKRNDTR